MLFYLDLECFNNNNLVLDMSAITTKPHTLYYGILVTTCHIASSKLRAVTSDIIRMYPQKLNEPLDELILIIHLLLVAARYLLIMARSSLLTISQVVTVFP